MATNPYFDKSYTEKCSEKTLQSNSKGFFLSFADNVAENAGKEWIDNVFGKLKSDKERIRIIFSYKGTKNVVTEFLSNVQEVYRKKNAEVSQAKRFEAETLLKNGDTQNALILFSQSVLRSPKTGENTKIDCGVSLSLALWGRSQALMKLNEYSLSLADIQLSLKENLPNIHKGEAYWRMAICYKALKEENRAKVSFVLAEKLLQNENKLKEMEKDKSKTFVENVKKNRRVEPPILGERHHKFPNATKNITLKKSKEKGRYIVANSRIDCGDTIVVEEPYAACLLPDMFGTHCHHCFDRLISPIGCPDCSSVAFCNIECRDAALSSYHKYECKFLDLLIGSGMSILAHTALKMITKNSLDKCMEMYRDRNKENIFSLCTNASMRPAADFLQRTLMAAFLLKCLQKAGFFPKRTGDEAIPTEEEFCVGELLLFNLQMLQFNAHEIYETRQSAEHRFRGSRTVYIGVAVYPTVALFNHDCYPAVTRHFVGKKIVIRACRPLEPDEIVAENYGPIFTRKCLRERKRTLASRYWFDCQCNACAFNWPSLDEGLSDVSKRIRCPSKGCSQYFTLPLSNERLQCPKCKQNVSLYERKLLLEWCEEQYKLGFETMDSQEPEKAIDILCVAIDTFHKISSPPHRETHLAQETLRSCVADSGNVFETLIRKK